jgi:hypothetical protein
MFGKTTPPEKNLYLLQDLNSTLSFVSGINIVAM